MTKTNSSIEVVADLGSLPLERNTSRDRIRAGSRAYRPAQRGCAAEVGLKAIARQTKRTEVSNVRRAKAAAVVESDACMFCRRRDETNAARKIMSLQTIVRPERFAANERTVCRVRLVRSAIESQRAAETQLVWNCFVNVLHIKAIEKITRAVRYTRPGKCADAG